MNKVFYGDCLVVMPKLDIKVDMILADLPYGTTACKWDTPIPPEPLWENYKRLIKDNGAIVLTASQPFTSVLVMSNPKMFKYEWIWEKSKATGHLDVKRKPLKKHESVLVFYSSLPTYNPQGLIKGIFKTGRDANMDGKVYGQYKNHGISEYGNYPKSIIRINNPSQSGNEHPTKKPVELFEYLIKTYTNEGETVLDNTAGVMTTAIACINTNRNYICIEKDKGYYEKGLERIEKHRQQLKLAI